MMIHSTIYSPIRCEMLLHFFYSLEPYQNEIGMQLASYRTLVSENRIAMRALGMCESSRNAGIFPEFTPEQWLYEAHK